MARRLAWWPELCFSQAVPIDWPSLPMTEPCDLSAVDARARIGRKQLSPVELLESCIARIEAVDAAVNAMVARDYEGARADRAQRRSGGDARR